MASCTVALRPGRNSVVLLARDAAGHVTSRGIRVTRTGTSTALTLTPGTRTLLVEESAALSLLDDFGSPITAATWTTCDPAIVELSTDDPPVLTALAPGTATITAAKNGLSATATITVVAGTSLPDGTTRWTVPATPGTQLGPTIYTHRVEETVPDLFVTDASGATPETTVYSVKGTMGDGTVLWTEEAPGQPAFGDEDGGLVATVGTWPDVTALARFAGPAGAGPWRYTSRGRLGVGYTNGQDAPGHPEVAQGPDGTIFVVELAGNPTLAWATALGAWDKQLVALDGATGAVKFRVPLPRYTYRSVAEGPPALEQQWETPVSAPVVGEDGAAYLEVVSGAIVTNPLGILRGAIQRGQVTRTRFPDSSRDLTCCD